ncbi:MAG: hypothetical protein ACTHJ7_04995 [Candidatus Nitrosocosmicus sp.]
MKRFLTFLIALFVFSTAMYFEYDLTVPNVYSQSEMSQRFINGPLSGISQNTNGKVDWVISGNWKSVSLSNTNNENSNAFDAIIEMIKPDGSGRHVHTLNFTVTDVSYPSSSTIMYNGISTVTMRDEIISNVPTTLVLSNNNIISIMLDPDSVQHHFGDSPFYGIVADSNESKGIINELTNGQLGKQLQGSINGLTNGIMRGTMNDIKNGLQNGPIGGLLHGLLP